MVHMSTTELRSQKVKMVLQVDYTSRLNNHLRLPYYHFYIHVHVLLVCSLMNKVFVNQQSEREREREVYARACKQFEL